MAWNTLNYSHLISAVSMGATITSDPQRVQFQDNIGIQLIWTGTPVGTFDIQVSINYDPQIAGQSGSWASLPLSTSIAAAGSADNAYIDLNQLSAPWIRIVYTRTSGTGTLDAYIAAKGV